MALLAMTFPISPGKSDHWHAFMRELQGPRRQDFMVSRKEMNVRERTFLQRTPAGDVVIVTLEGQHPESAMTQFARQNTDFARWFVAQVKDIHGVDLTQPPPGPMPKQVIDSNGG